MKSPPYEGVFPWVIFFTRVYRSWFFIALSSHLLGLSSHLKMATRKSFNQIAVCFLLLVSGAFWHSKFRNHPYSNHFQVLFAFYLRKGNMSSLNKQLLVPLGSQNPSKAWLESSMVPPTLLGLHGVMSIHLCGRVVALNIISLCITIINYNYVCFIILQHLPRGAK